MNIESESFSELGPRKKNEDRVLAPFSLNGAWVTAIADGVGGSADGGRAADIAIEGIRQVRATDELPDLIRQLSQRIARAELEQDGLSGMATTLTLAVLRDWKASVAHIGDSRLYHIRSAGLVNLTSDQTLVATLMKQGILNERQAARYPRRNALTSVLSSDGQYDLYESAAVLRPGDRLLFTTDGVYNAVKRGAVLNASLASSSLREFIGALQRAVETSGPKDNYSALAIQVT